MQPTPPSNSSPEPYPQEFFLREDETEDGLFYTQPRLVIHVDEAAASAIADYFGRSLPHHGTLLDLMSSWRSHLPGDFPKQKLVGLGLNDVEMAENPQLDEKVVHDLNATPTLPFDDGYFDAAVVTVSIQYMVRPVEVFSQVNRVLKEGASFHVVYSNRMFHTKAVAVWKALDDTQRAQLIITYFHNSGGWDTARTNDIGGDRSPYADPVYVVTATKNTKSGADQRNPPVEDTNRS